MHTLIFLVVLYGMERHPGIEVHYMNPAWYMPAVGNVLVPYVGMILAGRGVPVSRSLLGIYLGAGTIMWMALFTIWLYRSLFFSPRGNSLSYEALLGFTPSIYRALYREAAAGPGGVVASLLSAVFDFFYYTFWGAAGMLFLLVLAITLSHARSLLFPFGYSYIEGASENQLRVWFLAIPFWVFYSASTTSTC